MRVPVPEAPEMTPAGAAWAVVIGAAIFFGTVALMALWPPLALSLNVLFLLVALWLMGGEWWNRRFGS